MTPWLRDGPGAVLSLFREHPLGLTKTEVTQLTGLSRTAVSGRVDLLVDGGYLTPASPPVLERRGRPAERYVLDAARGVFLVADTGVTGMRAGLFDAAGTMLDEIYEAFDIADGPIRILGRVDARFRELLAERPLAQVRGIGIDLPGPVDIGTRRVLSPPIMPGWHNFDIPGYFEQRYGCTVVVEKDTNALAYGEFRREHPEVEDLLFVKLGTGIGTGIVLNGELYRGADGSAGDIGHVPYAPEAPAADAPLCRCGARGCVEAYAGGWALARDLTSSGTPARSVVEVIAAVRAGDEIARALVRRASQIIGAAVSDLVHVLNPRLVVFGGQLSELDEIVLATAREVIYGRALPLATRRMQITSIQIEDPGVYGLAELVADEVYSPAAVDASVLAD